MIALCKWFKFCHQTHMESLQLFMILLGGRPKSRNTEQHDIFFGVGTRLSELVPAIKKFWPDAASNLHIDAWRAVTSVDGYRVAVYDRKTGPAAKSSENKRLFFINLGGYKENEFDEFHYKILTAAGDINTAKQQAKKFSFYQHYNLASNPVFNNAGSHIDDKYGIDVDEAFAVDDLLSEQVKMQYTISLFKEEQAGVAPDQIHLGYFRLKDLK